MSEIYEIISDKVRSVSQELGTKEKMDEQFSDVTDEFDEIDFNKYGKAIIKVSTAISNNVLLETLQTLEERGYFSTKD